MIPPHVTHPPVSTASAGKPLEISVALEISGGKAVPKVAIVDAATNETVGTSAGTSASQGNTTVKVTVPAVKLWSPEDRNLYYAVVSIHAQAAAEEADSVLDTVTTRFGVRTITTDGRYQFLLNGQRVFLAGYGDDAIYPLTVSPPRTKAPYEQVCSPNLTVGFSQSSYISTTYRVTSRRSSLRTSWASILCGTTAESAWARSTLLRRTSASLSLSLSLSL